MKKEEIVNKIMLSDDDYWADLYTEYVRKGLLAEKKSKLIKILSDIEE